MGRLVPAEEDAGSGVSEWGGARGGKGELGVTVPTHALLHGIRGGGLGDGIRFPLFFLLFGFFSFVVSLVRVISSWLQRAASRGQQKGNPDKKVHR